MPSPAEIPARRAAAAIALACALAAAALTASGCAGATRAALPREAAGASHAAGGAAAGGGAAPALRERESPVARRLALAAMRQVGVTTGYDASYVPLHYPGGDVPLSTGVCSDVVVRAFRGVGIDLQVKLHEDMSAHFSAYPHVWGLSHPDPNIDQRRVPNLACYFARHGAARRVTSAGADYWPGDIVVWSVNGRPHVGVVSVTPAADGSRFLVTHNIGAGTRTEDVLFAYEITGHYRPL